MSADKEKTWDFIIVGVGPASRLSPLGVEMTHDMAGVGEGLQDHLEVYVQYACKEPVSLYPATAWWRQPWIGAQWLFGRTGIGASNQFEAGGFIRTNDEVEQPNVQFHFLPIAIRYDGQSPHDGHGYQVHVGPTLSDARGHVRIKSTDAEEHPSILFNYLSTEQDRREWVESIRCARRILNSPAMEALRGDELAPGEEVQTDQQILDFIRQEGESAYHPSCTCRMGQDHTAVTDPEFRVHGLEALRVVDASAMPSITNGNIYAPMLMMAERAADLIRGNTPLPPDPAPFHRHEAAQLIPGALSGSRGPCASARSGSTTTTSTSRPRRGAATSARASAGSWAGGGWTSTPNSSTDTSTWPPNLWAGSLETGRHDHSHQDSHSSPGHPLCIHPHHRLARARIRGACQRGGIGQVGGQHRPLLRHPLHLPRL